MVMPDRNTPAPRTEKNGDLLKATVLADRGVGNRCRKGSALNAL